jgi:hypothetical protein
MQTKHGEDVLEMSSDKFTKYLHSQTLTIK